MNARQCSEEAREISLNKSLFFFGGGSCCDKFVSIRTNKAVIEEETKCWTDVNEQESSFLCRFVFFCFLFYLAFFLER